VLLGAESPDFDYVIRLVAGKVAYLKHHRGPTHGLVMLPLHALLWGGLVRLFAPGIPFWELFLWTLLGGLSHVGFDFLNDYGTQGFWPFSRRWIALDIIPIVDVWMLGIITAGWLVEFAWAGHRQAIFGVVWLLLAAYVACRFWLRRRAWRLVSDRLQMSGTCGEHMPCGGGWREERLMIHPTLLSLNAWRYVAQNEGEYLTGMVWVRQAKVGQPVRSQNLHDRVVLASLKAQVVGAFADWVRKPRVTVERRQDMYLVKWTDMRYDSEDFSPFTAFAWLDDELKLVDEGLGEQAPSEIKGDDLKRRLRKEMGRSES
jgi:inner membrane protein